jgi:hypothetical protein
MLELVDRRGNDALLIAFLGSDLSQQRGVALARAYRCRRRRGSACDQGCEREREQG